MEKGLSKQGNLLSNASYGTLISKPMTQLSPEDPWAIVDLVDDSKKWAGKLKRP